MRYISEELSGPTVFKAVEKLDFDYVPAELPNRNEQLRKLVRIFGQILKSNISENAFIKGNVGTGKTVMAKKFCIDFKKYSEDQYLFAAQTSKSSEDLASQELSPNSQMTYSTLRDEEQIDIGPSESRETREEPGLQETIKPEEITTTEGPGKMFKICPYCGEELNLPKKPNFCPYCKESLV